MEAKWFVYCHGANRVHHYAESGQTRREAVARVRQLTGDEPPIGHLRRIGRGAYQYYSLRTLERKDRWYVFTRAGVGRVRIRKVPLQKLLPWNRPISELLQRKAPQL